MGTVVAAGAPGLPSTLAYLALRIMPGVALTLWGVWSPTPQRRLSTLPRALACIAYAALFFYLTCLYRPHFYVEGSIVLCALTVLLAWLLSKRSALESAYVGLSVSGCLQVTQSLVMSVLTVNAEDVDAFLASMDPANLALEPLAALLALAPVAAVRRQARLGLDDTLRPHHLLALVPPFVLYICLSLWQMPSFDATYREVPQVQAIALTLASLSIVLALLLPLSQLALTRQRVENARLEGLMHERYRGTMRHQEASEEMARILHDLRNQVACIAETDDEEVRRRHLASIEEEVSTWRTVRYTGDATLDVVLNQKRRAARQAGVEFQATPLALPEGFMPSVDVCSVFGNALDNALEACARMPEGSYRYVDVSLSRAGSYLAAVVKNPYAGEYDLRYDMDTEVLTDRAGNETDACAVCISNWPGNPDIDNAQEEYPVWEGPCEMLPSQKPWMDAIAAEFAADANLTQLFSTWGRQLVCDENGAVTGVFAEDADGKVYKIGAAKGVVLATGGYLANQDMVDYYLHELSLYPNVIWYQSDAKGELSHNGSGILMGHWAGGAVDDNPHAFILHGFGGGLGQDPFLFVNKFGERFMNENVLANLISCNIGHAPDGYFWQIFDDNYPEQVGAMQSGHAAYWKIVDDADDVPWGNFMEGAGVTTRAQVEAKTDFICNSVEEIAEQTGMPLETLQATIERYNELAAAGFDADFGKPAKRLFPIEKPPFYVKKFKTEGVGMDAETVFTSLNGLKSNSEAQVLKADGTPVPNLYCCGNCQGSRFAFDYPVTYMGVSHGLAMTYGYIAGMNAAAGGKA